ncbi:glycosyltransferase family 4 protein [Rahnella inusitata]|uniref:glycosyltransferase family 4 protein n=1 Tax=Rahnella inusitata TaxID=58169 RepID=UPI0039B06DCA
MKVIFGTDPIKNPLTGIGRYAYELANCLSVSPEISELLFLHGRKISRHIPEAKGSNFTSQGLRQMVQRSKLASKLYGVSAPLLKSFALKKYPDAIYHSPNFYLPPKTGPSVATFHDLSVFTWAQCHPAGRVRFMQKEIILSMKRADILITDSDFTRHEVIEYFNLPTNKVFSAKLASSGEFYPRDSESIASVVTKLGLQPGKYCLFTGSIEPRKNIETLLSAYERLPHVIRQAFPLVISGFKGWRSELLHTRFEKAEREGWLRYLGYTKSTELPYLFAGAASFLFPSLYEGFGLPVLEAMASGVPVVCSNSSSLPEVVGDSALTCAALDVETLTLLIQKSIEDNTWRELAIQKGLIQAKTFSWQRCAAETIHAYKQV